MKKGFIKLTAAFSLAAACLTGCGAEQLKAGVEQPKGPVQTMCSAPATSAVTTTTPSGPATIQGPATIPKIEGLNTPIQDDLDSSIPGTGIALGGDGAGDNGYPQICLPGRYQGRNPLQVPHNHRPLPTGTAVGPNGEHYAFYAVIPYVPGAGFKHPDTVIVDLAHPEKILFKLQGYAQLSGVYDKKTDRMIILGNTKGEETRVLWQSAPVSQNPVWWETLQLLGEFSGPMNGDRESQIVALPKGGFLIVAADERDQRTMPLLGVTADTPEGLLTAKPTVLVQPKDLPQVYGPTVVNIEDTKCGELVTMRVSTYGKIHPHHYDPHTYSSTFKIKRPGPC